MEKEFQRMQKAVNVAVDIIRESSNRVYGRKDIARVATISANDKIIGRLIADAMEKLTADGVTTVQESITADTYGSNGRYIV